MWNLLINPWTYGGIIFPAAPIYFFWCAVLRSNALSLYHDMIVAKVKRFTFFWVNAAHGWESYKWAIITF